LDCLRLAFTEQCHNLLKHELVQCFSIFSITPNTNSYIYNLKTPNTVKKRFLNTCGPRTVDSSWKS